MSAKGGYVHLSLFGIFYIKRFWGNAQNVFLLKTCGYSVNLGLLDEEMPGNADWERDASGEAHWTDGARLPAPSALSPVPRAPRPGPPFFLFYLALRGGPALARSAVV
jgi:hypothetical protein